MAIKNIKGLKGRKDEEYEKWAKLKVSVPNSFLQILFIHGASAFFGSFPRI